MFFYRQKEEFKPRRGLEIWLPRRNFEPPPRHPEGRPFRVLRDEWGPGLAGHPVCLPQCVRPVTPMGGRTNCFPMELLGHRSCPSQLDDDCFLFFQVLRRRLRGSTPTRAHYQCWNVHGLKNFTAHSRKRENPVLLTAAVYLSKGGAQSSFRPTDQDTRTQRHTFETKGRHPFQEGTECLFNKIERNLGASSILTRVSAETASFASPAVPRRRDVLPLTYEMRMLLVQRKLLGIMCRLRHYLVEVRLVLCTFACALPTL